MARSCNLIFIVLDVLKPLADKAILEAELYDCGIRLNVEPPQVQLKKKEKGGINMSSALHDVERMADVCRHCPADSPSVHTLRRACLIEQSTLTRSGRSCPSTECGQFGTSLR